MVNRLFNNQVDSIHSSDKHLNLAIKLELEILEIKIDKERLEIKIDKEHL